MPFGSTAWQSHDADFGIGRRDDAGPDVGSLAAAVGAEVPVGGGIAGYAGENAVMKDSDFIRTDKWSHHIVRLNRSKRKYPAEHGYKSRLYNIWKCMRFRCYYPSHEAYSRYGGSGITVCAEWKDDYLCFRQWALANGYNDGLSIDRQNNLLGYDGVNCRWKTMAQQQSNRRDNLPPLHAYGESKTLKEWSTDQRCVVTYSRLWKRLKSGRSLEWSIITPPRGTTVKLLEAENEL